MNNADRDFQWKTKHTVFVCCGLVLLLLISGWFWLFFKLLLWVALALALIAAIAVGINWRTAAVTKSSLEEVQNAQRAFVIASLIAVGLLAGIWSFPTSNYNTALGKSIAPGSRLNNLSITGKNTEKSLDRPSLALASATLNGSWEESDVFFNDTAAWSGTAFVVSRNSGKLLLFTNSHCLNLSGLAKTDDDRSIEILRYDLSVKFPSGKTKRVLRLAEESTNLDLAQLEVSADDLKEGIDYVIVPDGSSLQIAIGERVVAVGSPLNEYLAGTHTFGSVSAIRTNAPSGEKCKTIQHDAAINGGNSGGPLFLERDGRMFWVGVNTWRFDGAQGIFFSIAADEAQKAKYEWTDATPSGVAKLLTRFFGVSASATSN